MHAGTHPGSRYRRIGLAFAASWMLCSAPRCASVAAASAESRAVPPPIHEVLIARRGWHVDVGLAVEALGPGLRPLAREFPGARYLFFGFGDLRYLLSQHRHGPVLLAALWPGRALLLITAIAGAPEAAFGASQVRRLPLSAQQEERLEEFLRAAFAVSLPAPPYAPGPYEDSAYYLAKARYSAVHTCNTWVAEALQAADLPIRSRGVLFASQLWRRVARLAIARPPAAPQERAVSCRAAAARSDTPPSSGRSAVPPRSSSAAPAGSSC